VLRQPRRRKYRKARGIDDGQLQIGRPCDVRHAIRIDMIREIGLEGKHGVEAIADVIAIVAAVVKIEFAVNCRSGEEIDDVAIIAQLMASSCKLMSVPELMMVLLPLTKIASAVVPAASMIPWLMSVLTAIYSAMTVFASSSVPT
jgi:hypothetical protein